MIDYFTPPMTPEEAVLRRILGNFRRDFVAGAIQKDGLASIPDAWKTSSISEVLKSMLQGQHPRARGGEDLPELLEGEVEIARMTLANSVHGEVTSLRAARPRGKSSEIHFRMVDEYGEEIVLPVEAANAPLETEAVLAMFRDSEPSQTEISCEKEFQSFFYPDINEVAHRLGLK